MLVAGLSRQNLVIVIVCAVIGGLILLAILFRSCRSRTNTTPLPPVQPLAHQREHQLAQFEASIHPHPYDTAFLAPRPPHSPQLSTRGSKSSLLGSASSPHSSYTPTGEGSEDLANLSPLEPESPHPARHPYLTTLTPASSSVNLTDSPISSSITPLPSSAPSRKSKSLLRPSRDDQSRPHHHPPLSVTSSSSRIYSRRGLPHGPHSQVQVVLPAPLAPGIAPTSVLYESDTPSERTSIVDRWIPAGRDSITFPNHSPSSVGLPRTPLRTSSNPTGMTTGPQINHRQYPSMPDVGREHEPPVPRVPSIYGQTADDERRKLTRDE